MHDKFFCHAIGFVDGKHTAIQVVIGDPETFLDIFKRQDVCDCMFVKLHFSIVADESLFGGIQNTSVPLDGHFLVCIPHF